MTDQEIEAATLSDAREHGLHRYEVYPLIRVRDRALIGMYSREKGWLWRRYDEVSES